MSDTDPDPGQLSRQHLVEIFWTGIVDSEIPAASPSRSRRPVAVMFGGQTGAGKSTLATAVVAELGLGGAAVISTDTLRAYHPRLAWLLRHDEEHANEVTDPDARQWVQMAIAEAITCRVDVVVDGTLSRPEVAAQAAGVFRGGGYATAVVLVAAPAAFSRLGILQRYQAQREHRGHGRFVHNHDETYTGVLATAGALDEDRFADEVRVYRRGGVLLYANTLDNNGAWRGPAGARQAIETERSRPRSPQELTEHLQAARDLAERMDPRWHARIAEAIRAALPLTTDPATIQALARAADELTPTPTSDPGPTEADLAARTTRRRPATAPPPTRQPPRRSPPPR